MPRIERSGKVFVLLLAIVATSTGSWWVFAPSPLAVGPVEQSNVQPLTEVERDAIWCLLAEIDLDREALIGLNVTEEQAASVLQTVRDWRGAHRSELESAQAALRERMAALRAAGRKLQLGESHAAEQLTEAQVGVAAARAQYVELLGGLRTALSSGLSESQRTTWAVIAHGWGRAMPVRMLELTDEQKLAYARLLRRQELRGPSEVDGEPIVAARGADAGPDSIFTPENLQAIEAYNGYATEAAAAVAAAEEETLPVAGGQVG